jgi:hypothetical protein
MADITERLDPDRWIAEGKALANYPILEAFSLHARLVDVVLGDKRELAAHISRWMTRAAEVHLAQARDRQEIVCGPLTEENLRSLWEETRTETPTKPLYNLEKKNDILTKPDDIASEDSIAFAVSEALGRQARG